MARKAIVKYRSLRSNLVHLPLSLFAQLAQQQARPQGLVIHLNPVSPFSSSSSRRPKSAYLGWSGLAASSSLSQAGGGVESIEVDPEVAMGLGWSEGTLVDISVIHNPTKARSISVTPLTSDDWEILEQHASFLENHLLSQLRAAQKGQEIDVWVAGRTKIRIRVDDTSPTCSLKDAVLITPDTEIYVAPRPRSSSSNIAEAESSKIINPSSAPSQTQANGVSIAAGGVRLRLVPSRITASWGRPPIISTVKLCKVALCSARTIDTVRRKLSFKQGADTNATIILRDEETQTESAEIGEATVKQSEVVVSPWEEMPDGCVTVIGSLEEWEDSWATVTMVASLGGQSKQKQEKGKTTKAPISESLTSHDLPGSTTTIAEAISHLSRSFGAGSVRPLILLGNKGSGKTTIAKSVARTLETNRCFLAETIYEDVGKIDPESRLSTIKETMSAWIARAKKRRPCCLILDGIDSLLGPETELNSSSNPAILADHFCRLISQNALPPGVLVITTATSSASLHPMLNAKHVFGESFKIPPLTKQVRQEVLQILVEQKRPTPVSNGQVNGGNDEDVDFVSLGGTTEGYSIADLNDLVQGAVQQGIMRSAKAGDTMVHLTAGDFSLAQEAFIPLSLRGASLQKSEVKWSDIGGLHEPRKILRETLEWPTKYAQIFANCPLRLRSGLLLYGYPGCGKTLLASAVARECGLNFISVKGPEILNKYIGASEKAVRDLFERASAAKPCVLFFDEFDSIAPKRGHDSTGVTDRVVNQMLTEMDGAQGLSGVYVLAATSRPDLIDPALLRPGRLDKSILCDMPSFSDRLDILRSISAKLHVSNDVDWDDLADKTEGMSGADLQAVVYNAHLEVVHHSLDVRSQNGHEDVVSGKGKGKGKEMGPAGGLVNGDSKRVSRTTFRQLVPKAEEKSAAARGEIVSRLETIVKNSSPYHTDKETGRGETKEIFKPQIEHRHLIRSLQSTRPSVAVKDRRRLELIYRSFVSERDGSMGNGDLGRDTGTRVSLM